MTKSEACEFCGKIQGAFWNCYYELSPDGKHFYHFCDPCKSKWVAFARKHGVKFEEVKGYADGCSCHFLPINGNKSPRNFVKKIWLEFIRRRFWKFSKEYLEYLADEKVIFT
jgi:hypothetical protein